MNPSSQPQYHSYFLSQAKCAVPNVSENWYVQNCPFDNWKNSCGVTMWSRRRALRSVSVKKSFRSRVRRNAARASSAPASIGASSGWISGSTRRTAAGLGSRRTAILLHAKKPAMSATRSGYFRCSTSTISSYAYRFVTSRLWPSLDSRQRRKDPPVRESNAAMRTLASRKTVGRDVLRERFTEATDRLSETTLSVSSLPQDALSAKAPHPDPAPRHSSSRDSGAVPSEFLPLLVESFSRSWDSLVPFQHSTGR